MTWKIQRAPEIWKVVDAETGTIIAEALTIEELKVQLLKTFKQN